MAWWSALSLSAVAVLALQTLGWVAAGLRGETSAATDPLHMAAATLAAFGVATWIGHAGLGGSLSLTSLRLIPIRSRSVILSASAGAALQLPIAELGNVLAEYSPVFLTPVDAQLSRRQLFEPGTFQDGLVTVMVVVAIIPFVEEVFFRGFLWSGIAARHGQTTALWTVTFAFGCIHMTPPAIATAWIAGLALGGVSLWTRSAISSLAMHMGFNAVPLLLPERAVRIPGFNTVSPDVLHVSWLAVAISAAVAAVSLSLVSRSEAKECT